MLKAQKGALWQKIRSADENSKKGTIFADGSRNWNRPDQKSLHASVFVNINHVKLEPTPFHLRPTFKSYIPASMKYAG